MPLDPLHAEILQIASGLPEFNVAAYQRQAMRVLFQYVKEHRLDD